MGVLSVIRTFDEIVSDVGANRKVTVISCNNCVRGCGCGGENHLPEICRSLEARGVSIVESILIANPCSRGYLENHTFLDPLSTIVFFACPGAQVGLKALHPTVRIVPGINSLGLGISSKKLGRLKLVATFPGYESLMGKEFKLGNTSISYDDQLLK